MDISKVDVNIFNEIPQALKVPDLLKSFKLADEKKVTHLCIKNHINALKMYGQFFDDQLMNFEVDASFNADIIDFKACTFVALVDSFSWKVAVGFANEKLNINILTDQIPIKFGPSIGHALYTAQAAWERNLAKEANGVVGIEGNVFSKYYFVQIYNL